MNATTDVGVMSVNDVIRLYPQTVEIFNRFGIDACCGGAASVRAASVRDGANGDELIGELQRVMAGTA